MSEIIELEPETRTMNAAPRQDIAAFVAASPLDLPTPIFTEALNRRSANRAALMQWIKDALIEGSDFGKIHTAGKNRCQFAAQYRGNECPNPKHWSKPVLFKPGAEKVTGMLGVTAHYPTLAEYERAALNGVDLKSVILRCELRDGSGKVLAEGIGARALAKDDNDLNKSLKMSEKSALIDAALRLGGLSEVFTQDLEDQPADRDEPPPPAAARPQPSPEPPPQPAPNPAAPIGDNGTKRRIEQAITNLGLNRDGVKLYCKQQWNREHFADLLKPEAERLLLEMPRMASQKARKQLLAVIDNAQNTAVLNSILAARKDYPLISDIDWDSYIPQAIDAKWQQLEAVTDEQPA